jgi:hypothetical protein
MGDVTTGTTILSEMYERYAAHGERIDFESLLSSLGVAEDGNDVDDSRPLAWIRRRIVDDRVARRLEVRTKNTMTVWGSPIMALDAVHDR